MPIAESFRFAREFKINILFNKLTSAKEKGEIVLLLKCIVGVRSVLAMDQMVM